jgi:hypothetical protein
MMGMVEERLRALEVKIGAAVDCARACAMLLREADDDDVRYLMAERLPVLGSSIVPELNEMLVDPACSRSTKYLAAWVAVEVGDRGDSVDVLCAEVEAGSEWALAAAGVLGRHRITEGREPILRALERVNPKDSGEVLGYATALRELRGELPHRLRLKLVTESDPWVRRAVEEDFAL